MNLSHIRIKNTNILKHADQNLIIEKCLERNAGPYYIIPNFRDYARKLNIKIPEETAAEMSSDLYDNDMVFQFYSKSNKGPKP